MHPLLRFTLDLFGSEPPVKRPATPAKPRVRRKPAASTDPQLLTSTVDFRHPRANREARLCDAHVAFEFKRAKRRTIGFVVGPDGLVVRAPNWVPLYEVDAALQEKAAWIIRKLQETRERHRRSVVARIDWCDGVTFPYLGTPLRVVIDPSHGHGSAGAHLHMQESAQTLQVPLARSASPAQLRDAVQAWLMQQARSHFTERLNHFAPQLGVRWQKLALSNASTRWGSARADGSIRLNWRLIHMRPAIIDYVVAHELSHLRAMDHSPQFWDTVATVVPDFADLRGQLKQVAVPRWD